MCYSLLLFVHCFFLSVMSSTICYLLVVFHRADLSLVMVGCNVINMLILCSFFLIWMVLFFYHFFLFFFKQKTEYEMRICDWSSDVCSSDLAMAHTRTRNLDVQRVLGWAGIGIGGEVEVENGEVVGQRYPLKSVPFDANTIGPILIEPAQIKATGMIGGTLAPEHVRDRKSVVWGKSVSVRVELGGRRS